MTNSPMLPIGSIAPDFDLPVLVGGVKERFRLSSYRGKQNLLLAFYPFNWEPSSADQLIAYQAEREEFQALETETVGICVDSIMNATAWEREIGPFDFPLCSDFWPHGVVCGQYDVLREQGPRAGSCERAIYLVSKAGRIEFSRMYRDEQVPSLQDTLEALRRI